MQVFRFLLYLTLLGFIALACSSQKIGYPDELVQLHENVLTNIFEDAADPADVAKWLDAMQEDGSWPDIDYSSKERGGWPPRQHLTQLLAIAKAYQTSGTPQYQQEAVSEKIHRALNLWLEKDLQCPNWWYPEIGVPMVLAPLMLLMEEELSPEQLQLGKKILDRSRIGMTGQNKVWLSGNVLMKALLFKDMDTIGLASRSIQEELVVSMGEGVQPDWSYHQHGPQLQFGNYGLSYASDMIKWITILRGTPFSFDEEKVAILRNYLLEGQQWITWKNKLDISACGRQLFVDAPAQKAKSLATSIRKMENLDPDFAAQYQAANQYETLNGNRHFWRSDIQIQRSPEYYFSVKMCSARVIGAESCNAENLQGYYLGDGATYLYQSGAEYENIFPFWDWKKVPGTTTQQDDEPLPVLTASGYRIESAFVGGVSDGENGIAVLDYNRNGLQAKKSWFMFDGKIICLGAGITSASGLPVTTSVNQSFIKGDAIIKTGSRKYLAGAMETLPDPTWVLHDHIGYFFPVGGHLQLQTRAVEGSWNRLVARYSDEKIIGDLFRLWFDHGMKPTGRSYAYVLLPNADPSVMEAMENHFPFKIRNETDRQEVVSGNDMAGIVFYRAGKSAVFGGVETDQPCILLLKKQGNGIQVSVADPTQQLAEISIAIQGKFTGASARSDGGTTTLSIALPQAGEAGKTVTMLLKEH